MLAISTATKTAMIAIEAAGKRIFSQIEADCRQSEKMMQEIDNLLSKNNLSLEDIGNFAVVIGPGSFTGLRIGAALIKGFCAALPKSKVVEIPTLDLMAAEVIKQVPMKSKFSCYMNAHSNLYYGATFDKNGKKLAPEKLYTNADILKGSESKFCLAEEGFLPFGINISPETLLDLALKMQDAGFLVCGKEIAVKYIRRSAAEEQ